jgi:hypothetical protein
MAERNPLERDPILFLMTTGMISILIMIQAEKAREYKWRKAR